MDSSELRSRKHAIVLRFVVLGVLGNGIITVASTLRTQSFIHALFEETLIVNLPLIAGMTLIYLATLLRRRKRAAWYATVAVYAVIVLLNTYELISTQLSRGVTAGEIIRNIVLPAFVLGGLLYYRNDFSVKSSIRNFRQSARVLALLFVIVMAYGTVGFMLLETRDFRTNFTIWQAMHHTIDQFDFSTNKQLVPFTDRGSVFIDSLSIISIVAILYGLASLFQPLQARLTDQQQDGRRVMESLLEKYSGISEDYFKVWPHDKLYFFSSSHTSGLAYQVSSGMALVVGDPAGDSETFKDMIQEFKEFCYANDWIPAFIHTEPNYSGLYKKHGFSLQKIGEEATVDIEYFEQNVRRNKYFRHIHNKFTKLGYSTELLRPPHSQELLDSLTQINADWLTQPGRSERGFMMGYFTHEYMQQCNIMVLRDGDGRIQAFLNQVHSYDTAEATYDLLRQASNAPGNCNDFLLLGFISECSQAGYKHLNMGLCPLVGLDNIDQDKTVIDSALQFLYANGDRLYSFGGLHRFKSKYEPVWSSRYIAYVGGIRTFTKLLAALNRLMNRVRT